MPQLSKGVEIRAQIDNEQIRSLLLINGGGAIALISILPKVFENKELVFLTKPILERIPIMFERSPLCERSSCILLR